MCLEVKGGEVWHDGDDVVAEAAAATNTRSHRFARPAKPATRYANTSRRTTAGPRAACAGITSIVLPNAEIADDFALPECPRWKVIDRNDLPDLVEQAQARPGPPGTAARPAHEGRASTSCRWR